MQTGLANRFSEDTGGDRRCQYPSRYDPGRCSRPSARCPAACASSWSTPLLILAGIGVSLRFVVDQAIEASVSFAGVVVMALLAYTIFTTTLVLQRKQAARGLALGLASLTVPLVPLLALSSLPIEAIFVAAFALLLFRGLLRPEVRAYLNEP